MQEVQGGAVIPQGGAPAGSARGPAGRGDLLQGGAQAGWGASAGGGPGGAVLQGAPGGAGPILGGQVLAAGLETPPPPALLIQGQRPLQLGPRRGRLWGEGFCLNLWVLTAAVYWALVVGGRGHGAEGEVFVCVQGAPQHSAYRPQTCVGGGLRGRRLRAPQAGGLGRHSPGDATTAAEPRRRRRLQGLSAAQRQGCAVTCPRRRNTEERTRLGSGSGLGRPSGGGARCCMAEALTSWSPPQGPKERSLLLARISCSGRAATAHGDGVDRPAAVGQKQATGHCGLPPPLRGWVNAGHLGQKPCSRWGDCPLRGAPGARPSANSHPQGEGRREPVHRRSLGWGPRQPSPARKPTTIAGPQTPPRGRRRGCERPGLRACDPGRRPRGSGGNDRRAAAVVGATPALRVTPRGAPPLEPRAPTLAPNPAHGSPRVQGPARPGPPSPPWGP